MRHLGLVSLLAVLLISASIVQCKGNKKKNKKDRPWCVKASHAGRKGIEIDCSTSGGKIASLSVVGVADQCHGLTARMFVEMNSCLWKSSCTLKKEKNDKYMVKLYKGDPGTCVTKSPTHFTVDYYCTPLDVPVLDVLANNTKPVEEKQGIMRSHKDHPWLYKRQGYEQLNLTLLRPDGPKTSTFVFTVRSLKLMHDDKLKVNDINVTDVATYDIKNTDKVTVQLVTSHYSTGGEGFIICFKWVGDDIPTDACSGLISKGEGKKKSGFRKNCIKRSRGSSNKGKQRKQGKGKRKGKGKGRKGNKRGRRNKNKDNLNNVRRR